MNTTPIKPAENADRCSDLVSQIIRRNFSSVASELYVGDVGIRELAEKYGTPLFVYSRPALERTWRAFRSTYPREFDVYYSMKANPNQSVLQFFLHQGCGLEVASAGEIHQALRARCAPSSLIYAGPGKTNDELELALSIGVGEIHVESPGEARRISAISKRMGRRAAVALRINACGDVQGGAMRMGGKPSPFGIDEQQLDNLLDELAQDAELNISGVHLFTGTQILDYNILLAQYHKAVEIGRHVAKRLRQPLQTIDFGGGLGIPYFAHERPLDLSALASGLRALVAAVKGDELLSKARLIVEPGRFLIGEAGIYICRVVDVKPSHGKTFAIVDGGMHHHLAASGNLGQTIKRNFPVALLEKLDHPHAKPIDVVGPLCTPLDVLARNVDLPSARIGDLFGVFQSGAYARTASPLGFLSHPAPPEVWVDEGRHSLIRRRGRAEDLFHDQHCTPEQPGS